MSRTLSATVNTQDESLVSASRAYFYFNETEQLTVTFQDSDGDAVDLSGKTIQVAGKDIDDIDSADFLFTAEAAGESTGIVTFSVDMNTTELETYLTGINGKKIRLVIKDTTADVILLWDSSYLVRHPGITGDEGDPAPCTRKHNFTATTAPTTGDDTGDGYSVGSLWFDITADIAYTCLDATASAAVWLQISLTAAQIAHFTSTSNPHSVTPAQINAGLGDVSFSVNAQTGTTYSLQDSDHGKMVTLDNGSAITLTVPAGLRSDFYCSILQKGAGVATVTASGTTVNNRQSYTDTAGQWAAASIVHLGSNVYITQGDMA